MDEKYANLYLYRNLTIAASRCINKQAFYIGNGVMNIISKFLRTSLLQLAKANDTTTADLMILALPIPIVWRLTLELRQKIILSVVFTLGSMYVFALPSSLLLTRTDILYQTALVSSVSYVSSAS
jgi:hypothetical protein